MNTILSYESSLTVIDLAEDEQLTVRPKYSGKGMYGNECFAVSGTLNELAGFLIQLGSVTGDVSGLARAIRSDALGNGQIFYFPGFLLNEEAVKELLEES